IISRIKFVKTGTSVECPFISFSKKNRGSIMGWIKTNLEGVAIFEPKVWGDERGYFMETYNTKNFHDFPTIPNFVQDNEAFSSRGILRGLHYQTGTNAQSKLVRVI